jgi:TldD protein
MTQSLQQILGTALIERLLREGVGLGAGFCEVFAEQATTQQVALEDGQIRGVSASMTLGVGIRVIAGDEVGYAYSDDLDPKVLVKTAQVAASIAQKTAAPGTLAHGLQAVPCPNRYPLAQLPHTVPPRQKSDLLLRADAAARKHDSRITQVMGAYVDQTREILIATTDGELATDTQMMCRLHVTAVATDKSGEQRSGFHGGGGRVGIAHFDTFTPESVGAEASRMAIAQLGAKDAPAGPQTVVLSPGWSGILLHEAVGHGLEADFIRKGTSLYAGKLGQQVASPLCTVIDSGTLPHARGSLNIDDEGYVPTENRLIEDGILRGFLVDRISAEAMHIPRTGSGRRQNFRHAPMPRMTNTYMAPGEHHHDAIVQSVQNGLYCAAFGGGQVDITNGNFVFEVREGYMIENGKLSYPVKNATLIGVGPEALKKVSMVGNDPKLDPGIGTCGKDGQTVPVGVGMPTLRLDGLTVGGTRAL